MVYSVSKFGVCGFFDVLCYEFVGLEILVIIVYLGGVNINIVKFVWMFECVILEEIEVGLK